MTYKEGNVIMDKIYKTHYKSSIGLIEITATEDIILQVEFSVKSDNNAEKVPIILEKCVAQLDEYFNGNRKEFSVPFRINGTEFQEKVWKELLQIPFGHTVSYKAIAVLAGHNNAVRAVGNACGKNKIPVIIPCHRVIGRNGQLTGYGGELWRKEWLLEHEKALE